MAAQRSSFIDNLPAIKVLVKACRLQNELCVFKHGPPEP